MKQQIMDAICAKLDELQIPFSIKDDSYITVNTDFYEIGYGAEFKKIAYELNVFLDEANSAVSMYVKTVDQCLVAANGATRELASPSTTMFRKVKRFVYDKDGQGSVVTTDLGEVPNTVKNTAFKYGWKFSTALNLNKFHKTVDMNEVRLSRPDTSDILPEPEPELETPVKKPEPARKKRGFRRLFGGR
ncbi:hypothetical protein SAMN02745823_02317 [Sporobacter termitidis DSM 10068]|uniref:Uncharacterized protein n=1 Tax=Sporobacter termitidis DSM 10068 TaxID=1123282 RepID=A0A1M5Y7L4_9FIRM|nr:hypothetical protein [Sporobacter termitidis]SHI08047.1 hypothetical protein SAMN02745823_02317 [Sporobacter termitidis DSM 10068]